VADEKQTIRIGNALLDRFVHGGQYAVWQFQPRIPYLTRGFRHAGDQHCVALRGGDLGIQKIPERNAIEFFLPRRVFLAVINAGIDCVCVTWGFRTREQLKKAGATTIVDTPEELEKYVESE
jgi:hypothetical protein